MTTFRWLIRCRHLNESAQGFKAWLFHPDLGNEVVEGSLFISRYSIRFESEAFTEEIPTDRIVVELSHSADKIYFKDSQRPELSIYTMDQEVFDVSAFPQLAAARAKIADARGQRELSRSLRITLWVLIVCIGLTWLFSWATGFMIRSLVAKVPPQWEEDFGRAQIEGLAGESENYSNQVIQLTALAAPLVNSIPLGETKVKFYIVDNPSPNAFALPGGYVVVNTGLLTLAERPEELLGVLAHELAHVTQKHFARKIISAAGPVLIFGVFLHSRDSLLNVLSQGSGLMVVQGFSKEFETEADDVGWSYLVAANIDPRGMISMFQKLKTYEDSHGHRGSTPRAFESHPALEKRIARLESKWKRLSRQDGFIEIKTPVPTVRP